MKQSIQRSCAKDRNWVIVGISLSTAFLIGYAVAYTILSAQGSYAIAVRGAYGIKSYAWAPAGFVKDTRWNPNLLRLFWPLWRADNRFWHTEEDQSTGRFPVNTNEK